MKTLIALLAITSFSSFAVASDCYDSVFTEFKAQTEAYDYHDMSKNSAQHLAGSEGFESYGTFVELAYDMDVISYQASNEMWGGYGAYEIIVNPTNCAVLQMTEVYSE